MLTIDNVIPFVLKFRSRRRRNLNILQARAAEPALSQLALPSAAVELGQSAFIKATVSYEPSAMKLLLLVLAAADAEGSDDDA